jgi:hypothetical protein
MEMRNGYKTVIGKHESKGPFGTSRHGRSFREMGCNVVEWIQLAYGKAQL